MSDTLYGMTPALWSVKILVSHGHQVVADLAQQAVGALVSQRYLLGRCLMAMEEIGSFRDLGLSSPVHFATQHLGMSKREAQATLRISRRLETLPLLRQAALHGEISWSKVREVTAVATVDTEAMWLELCVKHNCKQIQKLVACTPAGGVPGTVGSKTSRKTSEYRCRFQPEVMMLIERGLQMMSKKVGKPLLFREGVERLFTELLADKPYDEAHEKILEEARKDLLAGKLSEEPLVQQAQEIAREMGITGSTADKREEQVFDTVAEEESQLPGATFDELRTAACGQLPVEFVKGLDLNSHSSHVGSPRETSQKAPPKVRRAGPERPVSLSSKRQRPRLLKNFMSHLRFNPDARFPTKAQRRALLRRDGYCCRTPGCTNHVWLEIHHVIRFSQGGKTIPNQLVSLCSRCHKNVESGKLRIEADQAGRLVFKDSNGNFLEKERRLERAIWLDYWLGWTGRETDSHWARALGFSKVA